MPATATKLTILSRHVCNYLRWRPAEEGDPESPVPHAAEGDFVCSHTLERFGPDERVADEGSCREGRTCYDLPEKPPRPGEQAEGASREGEGDRGPRSAKTAAGPDRKAEREEPARRAGRAEAAATAESRPR